MGGPIGEVGNTSVLKEVQGRRLQQGVLAESSIVEHIRC